MDHGWVIDERLGLTDVVLLLGPGDYNPSTSMWDEIRQRGHSKFAQQSAPFDSSGLRTTTMTHRDSACIPGPDWYFPQVPY